MRTTLFSTAMAFCYGCSHVQEISTRPVQISPAPRATRTAAPFQTTIEERPFPTPLSIPLPQEHYVKQMAWRIIHTPPLDTTGSLAGVDVPQGAWFETLSSLHIGDTLAITLDHLAEETTPPKEAAQGEKNPDPKTPEETQTHTLLTETYPHLLPQDPLKHPLMKSFKADIVSLTPRGDAWVTYERTSQGDIGSHKVHVRAKIAYEDLAQRAWNPLYTRHLTDITMVDTSSPGDTFQRKSDHWVDEFSFRLSGFHESESQYARQMEAKRKALETVQRSLREQSHVLGQERQKQAAERDQLIAQNAAKQNKIKELEESLAKHEKEAASAKEALGAVATKTVLPAVPSPAAPAAPAKPEGTP